MPIYKDEKTGNWFVKLYYTDYTGAKKQKLKRGFKLQREAKEWERDFLERQQGRPDMTFQTLYKLYEADLMTHTKRSTYQSILCIIKKHILPYWKDKKLNEITAADVRTWQGEIVRTDLSDHYKYAINHTLSLVFNFAVRYYRLPANPCNQVKSIGKQRRSLNFWTLDQFRLFLPTVKDEMLRVAFLTFFYSGIRCGELLALTVKDFDTTEKLIRISTTYHRYDGQDVLTTPKTSNSVRKVALPDFLVDEIKGVIAKIYEPEPDDRIFQTVTASRLSTAMKKGAAAADIPLIRIHDLRHSHVSLLIDMGFPPLLIAERIGDTVEMVNRVYGHLYPNRHSEVAEKLEKMKF